MGALRTVKRCIAVAVCALALVSSVIGLWHVCISYGLMSPLIALGVLAVFDGSALVFGLTVALLPRAWGAWVGVAVCALLSAGAQAAAAPLEAGWWRLLHGAPALGAIWALHNAVKPEKATRRRNAAPVRKADTRSKGAGIEAADAGLVTTASPGPLAVEPSHDASVIRLDGARRLGERYPPTASKPAGTAPSLSPEAMATRVRPLLGSDEPSQRRVWDLCKSIDPAWSQRNGRAVAALLKVEKEETGTGS